MTETSPFPNLHQSLWRKGEEFHHSERFCRKIIFHIILVYITICGNSLIKWVRRKLHFWTWSLLNHFGQCHCEATLSSLKSYGDQGSLMMSEKGKHHAHLPLRQKGGSGETQAGGCYVVIFCTQVILYLWTSFCMCYIHNQWQNNFLWFVVYFCLNNS